MHGCSDLSSSIASSAPITDAIYSFTFSVNALCSSIENSYRQSLFDVSE